MSNNDWLPITVCDAASRLEYSYSLQCLGSCVIRCNVCARLLLLTPQSSRNIYCAVCDEPLDISLEAMMMTPGVIVKAFNVEKPFDIENFLRVESVANHLRPSSVVRMGYLLVEKVALQHPSSAPNRSNSTPKSIKVLSALLKRSAPRSKTLCQMGWTQVLAVQNGSVLRFYTTRPQRTDAGLRHLLLETVDLTRTEIGRVAAHSPGGAGGLIYSAPRPARLSLRTADARFTLNVGTDLLTAWWQTCLERSVQVTRDRAAAIRSRGPETPTLNLDATREEDLQAADAALDSPTRKAIPTPIIAAPQVATMADDPPAPPLRTLSTAFQRDMTPAAATASGAFTDPGPSTSLLTVSYRSRSTLSLANPDPLVSPTISSPTTAAFTQVPRLRKARSYYLEQARAECLQSLAASGLPAAPKKYSPALSSGSSTTACSHGSGNPPADREDDDDSILSLDYYPTSPRRAATDGPATPRGDDESDVIHQTKSLVRIRSSGYTVIPPTQAAAPASPPSLSRSRSYAQVNSKRMSRYYPDSPFLDLANAYEAAHGLAAVCGKRIQDEDDDSEAEVSEPKKARDSFAEFSARVQPSHPADGPRTAPVPPPKPRRSLIQAVTTGQEYRPRNKATPTLPDLSTTVPLSALRNRRIMAPTDTPVRRPAPLPMNTSRTVPTKHLRTSIYAQGPRTGPAYAADSSAVLTNAKAKMAGSRLLGSSPNSVAHTLVPTPAPSDTETEAEYSASTVSGFASALPMPVPNQRRALLSPSTAASASSSSPSSLETLTRSTINASSPPSQLMASPMSTTSTAVNSPVLDPLVQLSRLNKAAQTILRNHAITHPAATPTLSTTVVSLATVVTSDLGSSSSSSSDDYLSSLQNPTAQSGGTASQTHTQATVEAYALAAHKGHLLTRATSLSCNSQSSTDTEGLGDEDDEEEDEEANLFKDARFNPYVRTQLKMARPASSVAKPLPPTPANNAVYRSTNPFYQLMAGRTLSNVV
ncbi:hypothetical protein IWQ60_005621 [Tieghemiomyces parasiticus]|uniref:PH domain-containing protein n=1 Tax=Tieghemiomyces parasiticus TaxID=78921 RepID=A0A9W8ABG3_9FUNG|nr:hypothetical protein IWQ60_005621 [Tieghemiomyces parasiticus]